MGVDLFYKITPGLRANLTINTDFAQTEVDERLVNLTRFPLFFPEKRDFFLDGATFFDFYVPRGRQNPNVAVQPFFSRRIGLSADGLPQTIDYGTKLTGQVGQQDIGFLHVRTGEDAGTDATGEGFTVLRLKRRLLAQSYVGMFYSRRDVRDTESITRQTAGADFRLATSTFRGSSNLEFNGFPPLEHRFRRYGPRGQPRLRPAPRLSERPVGSPDGIHRGPGGPRPRGRLHTAHWFSGLPAAVSICAAAESERLAPPARPRLRPRPANRHGQPISDSAVGPDAATFGTPLAREFRGEPHPDVRAPRGWISRSGEGIVLPTNSEYDFVRFRVSANTANRRVLAVQTRFEMGSFFSGTREEGLGRARYPGHAQASRSISGPSGTTSRWPKAPFKRGSIAWSPTPSSARGSTW